MSVTFVDIIDENDAGQRIDNFLMRRFKGVPKKKSRHFTQGRSSCEQFEGGKPRLQLADRIRFRPGSKAKASILNHTRLEHLRG